MSHEEAVEYAALTPAAPAAPDFSGRWRNQMASFMDLTIQGSTVTGIYNSASSSGGDPVKGTITGVTVSDLIAFTVLWTGSKSITSWTGQLVHRNGVETLRTLWHLVTDIPDDPQEPKNFWKATVAGADEFTR